MVFGAQQSSRPGPGLIDSLLRYRGAGNQEAIRDADKRIRDDLAQTYGALVDRVRQIARRLADERRIMDVPPVDEFAQTLDHFVDRVRTATYGYGGLMSELDPNPGLVEQIRQFDRGLTDGVAEIEAVVAALEAAANSGGDIAAAARRGTEAARALLARFDLRGQVVETGQPADRASVLAALSPGGGGGAHPAWDLDTGVALAVLGDDFVVDAKIGVDGGDTAFRLFRLTAEPEEWLFVPKSSDLGLARLQPAAAPAGGAGQPVEGGPFNVGAEGRGTGEVVGTGGSSGTRPVRFQVLIGANEPAARGLVLDWDGERQTFVGRAVHPDDVEIFGRPLGE